jgi:hypothetical protein
MAETRIWCASWRICPGLVALGALIHHQAAPTGSPYTQDQMEVASSPNKQKPLTRQLQTRHFSAHRNAGERHRLGPRTSPWRQRAFKWSRGLVPTGFLPLCIMGNGVIPMGKQSNNPLGGKVVAAPRTKLGSQSMELKTRSSASLGGWFSSRCIKGSPPLCRWRLPASFRFVTPGFTLRLVCGFRRQIASTTGRDTLLPRAK